MSAASVRGSGPWFAGPITNLGIQRFAAGRSRWERPARPTRPEVPCYAHARKDVQASTASKEPSTNPKGSAMNSIGRGRVGRIALSASAACLLLTGISIGATGSAGATSMYHKTLACEVTDTGGINDRSFNASAYLGLKEAVAVAPKSRSRTRCSRRRPTVTESTYETEIDSFVSEHCSIIITVGFLMSDATWNAAHAESRWTTSRRSTTVTRAPARTASRSSPTRATAMQHPGPDLRDPAGRVPRWLRGGGVRRGAQPFGARRWRPTVVSSSVP